MSGTSLGKYTAQGQSFTPRRREQFQEAGGVRPISHAMRVIAQTMSDNRVRNDVATARLKMEEGLIGLDEKYKEDTDLATLGERRGQDVKDLMEGVKDGIHHRAASFLATEFEKNAMRDARRAKAFVDKRDGEMRMAKMPEAMDLLKNKAIRSADGEEHAASMVEINEFMESHKPFMGDVAYAQMQNTVHDKIGFERALNSISGEGEFDPTPFMNLNPNQVGQLEARHYGVKREKLQKIREYQTDRANMLLPKLEDSLASALNEGVPMDGTEVMLAEMGRLGERGAAIKAKFEEQFGRSAKVWGVLDAVKSKPFSEQMMMMEALRPEPGGEGYRADMEMYQQAGKMVMQRAKAFQADQAGFVREEAERRVRDVADPWVKDEDLEPLVLKASMELQRELGAAVPKVLSTGQAKGMKDKYERADGDGKAEILEIVSGYGGFDRKALEELNLGLGHTFMAELYMDDPILGRKALEASAMKESDIAVDPETAKSIKKDIGSAFHAGPGELFKQVYNLTGNSDHLKLSEQLYDMTVKMGLAGSDATAAMDLLWNDRFDILVDDDVHIYTSKDIDADQVAAQLREFRRVLPEEFQAFKDGVWKNAEDGPGFVLLLPHGGKAMARDGKVIVVGYDELEGYVATNNNFQSVMGGGDFEKIMKAQGSHREVSSPLQRK